MPTLLTPHFTLEEMTITQVRSADNTPDPVQKANLKRLCLTLLEPIREQWGPVVVSSGFRSKTVNAAVGGSANSKHTEGLACDFILRDASLMKVMKWVVKESKLPYDQMIFEFGRWLHIGLASGTAKPRRQALMIFEPNKFLAFDEDRIPLQGYS